MEWIVIIVIGFICIAYPILLFLYIWYMPTSVIIIYFLWLIGSIASVALSKGKNKKWYEKAAVSFFLTFIFTLIFVGSIDTNHYMFDENNGMWFFAPALCLPMFIFIGDKIRSNIEKSRIEMQEKRIEELNNEMIKLESEILALRVQLINCNEINRFVMLLESCGCDVASIIEHPQVNRIKILSDEVEVKYKQIEEIRENVHMYQYNK